MIRGSQIERRREMMWSWKIESVNNDIVEYLKIDNVYLKE